MKAACNTFKTLPSSLLFGDQDEFEADADAVLLLSPQKQRNSHVLMFLPQPVTDENVVSGLLLPSIPVLSISDATEQAPPPPSPLICSCVVITVMLLLICSSNPCFNATSKPSYPQTGPLKGKMAPLRRYLVLTNAKKHLSRLRGSISYFY